MKKNPQIKTMSEAIDRYVLSEQIRPTILYPPKDLNISAPDPAPAPAPPAPTLHLPSTSDEIKRAIARLGNTSKIGGIAGLGYAFGDRWDLKKKFKKCKSQECRDEVLEALKSPVFKYIKDGALGTGIGYLIGSMLNGERSRTLNDVAKMNK